MHGPTDWKFLPVIVLLDSRFRYLSALLSRADRTVWISPNFEFLPRTELVHPHPKLHL